MHSGCYQVAFKSQLKNLSHVVTFQSENPLMSNEREPSPIGYFEVKVLSLECKEPNNFGVGLAQENFPMLKSVGTDRSVAMRGSAKICYLNVEERMSLGSLLNIDFKRKGTILGVGFVFRTQKVFFTINGKEVYQMRLPECMAGIKRLYPSVTLASLKDRVQINFGEGKTQFRFDLAKKVQVSNLFHRVFEFCLFTFCRFYACVDVLQRYL